MDGIFSKGSFSKGSSTDTDRVLIDNPRDNVSKDAGGDSIMLLRFMFSDVPLEKSFSPPAVIIFTCLVEVDVCGGSSCFMFSPQHSLPFLVTLSYLLRTIHVVFLRFYHGLWRFVGRA
jgi:hypothetical protein